MWESLFQINIWPLEPRQSPISQSSHPVIETSLPDWLMDLLTRYDPRRGTESWQIGSFHTCQSWLVSDIDHTSAVETSCRVLGRFSTEARSGMVIIQWLLTTCICVAHQHCPPSGHWLLNICRYQYNFLTWLAWVHYYFYLLFGFNSVLYLKYFQYGWI